MGRRGAGSGEYSLQIFLTTVASLTEDDFRRMANGGTLNREDLAQACGFGSKSTLTANADVKLALATLEEKLRAKGILAQRVAKVPGESDGGVSSNALHPKFDADTNKRIASAQMLESLQKKLAALEAENKALKEKLKKIEPYLQALKETGRLPR